MRQLKQMMRTRKEQMLGCGPCECLTLKCRRENDEFCGCGEGGGGSSKITELIGFPTDVSISEGTVSTYSFRFAPVKHYDDVGSQITFVDPYNLVETYITSRDDSGNARVNFSSPMGRTGSTLLQVYLNGEHYMDTLIQVTPYVYVDSIYNLPNTIDVYTGGGNGSNYEVLQFKFSPTNANNPFGEIGFESYDGEFIGFLSSTRANFDGDAWYSFGPQVGDDQVGQTYNYKAMIRGEYTGQDIGLRLIKGIIPTANYSMDSLSIERGTVNSQNRIEITDNITDPEELNSVRFEYDPNIVDVSCNAQQDGGRTLLHINVEGVGLGETYVTISFVDGVSFTLYVEVVPNMEDNIINRFETTSVYSNLTSEQQEQAVEDARQIIEAAGDDIIPFYSAMQEGRTFANYAEQMGLTPDTSGNCDSSVYTDNEAFIIYIGTAGAVGCEYLALVARRGITPHQELVNKQYISDYLDWVTQGTTYTYQFKDWDGEILKFGSLPEGETPVAPDVPERSGYRFIGWDPTVGPIGGDCLYLAQYEQIIPIESVSNLYIPEGIRVENVMRVNLREGQTVTCTLDYLPLNANDDSSVYFENICYDGTPVIYNIVSMENGVLTFTMTAPRINDTSMDWGTRTTIKVNGVSVDDIEAIIYPAFNINITPTTGGSVSNQNIYLAKDISELSYNIEGNEISFGGGGSSYEHLGNSIATADTGYIFWGFEINGEPLPSSGTIDSDMNITAKFVIDIPVESVSIPNTVTVAEGQTITTQMSYFPANATNFSNVTIETNVSYGENSEATIDSFSNGIAIVKVKAFLQPLDEDFANTNTQNVLLNDNIVGYFDVNINPNRFTIWLDCTGRCSIDPSDEITVYNDGVYDIIDNDLSFTIDGVQVGFVGVTIDSYDEFFGWRTGGGGSYDSAYIPSHGLVSELGAYWREEGMQLYLRAEATEDAPSY